jgi:hypothetical protein
MVRAVVIRDRDGRIPGTGCTGIVMVIGSTVDRTTERHAHEVCSVEGRKGTNDVSLSAVASAVM